MSGFVLPMTTWICSVSYRNLYEAVPILSFSLKHLAHHFHQNVTSSLSFFCRYYFGRCYSELAGLVLLPYSCKKWTPYSTCFHSIYVTIIIGKFNHCNYFASNKFRIVINNLPDNTTNESLNLKYLVSS